MNKNANSTFDIIEEDVQEHAPIVYRSIQEHYDRVANITIITGNDLFVSKIIESSSSTLGVLPGGVIYEKELLNNDEFRVATILHLCMSNSTKSMLSWEAFMAIKTIFERTIMMSNKENLSIDSLMMKSFNVDPSILPKSYLSRNMKIDEFNKAIDLIIKELNKLKNFKDEYSNYEEYFSYIKDEVIKIEGICHENGYFGTHEIERFACLSLAYKMKLPEFDVLYKINAADDYGMRMTTEQIKSVQEQLVSKLYGYNGDDDE